MGSSAGPGSFNAPGVALEMTDSCRIPPCCCWQLGGTVLVVLLCYQQLKFPPVPAHSAPAVESTKLLSCGHSLQRREATTSGRCVGPSRVPPGNAGSPLIKQRALISKRFINLGVGPALPPLSACPDGLRGEHLFLLGLGVGGFPLFCSL